MTKYIIASIATLALASCEGLNVSLDNDKFSGSYSQEGGLIVSPKAVTIIAPAK